MIKIQNNLATREPLPAFLNGLAQESLADLSWTDPALGVSNAAWYPEVDQSLPLQEYERYGEETLTIDTVNKQVIVTRTVIPWTPEEIEADKLAKYKASIPTSITPRQIRLQLSTIGMRQAVEDYVASASLEIKDWWEFSLAYERNAPLLVEAATTLGMTSEQLDQFFVEANKL